MPDVPADSDTCMEKRKTRSSKPGGSTAVVSFSVWISREQSKGAMKRQEDERIKVSEPEPDKRAEEKE